METTDVQRMADSVLRDYGVPLKVARSRRPKLAGPLPSQRRARARLPKQVSLRCGERSSIHHVRESLKRGLDVCRTRLAYVASAFSVSVRP